MLPCDSWRTENKTPSMTIILVQTDTHQEMSTHPFETFWGMLNPKGSSVLSISIEISFSATKCRLDGIFHTLFGRNVCVFVRGPFSAQSSLFSPLLPMLSPVPANRRTPRDVAREFRVCLGRLHSSSSPSSVSSVALAVLALG